jgi:WS/DGAT/MGAT family acyltransferase
MDRMTPLDAAFLEAEDADRHTSMAIASIAVFTGPMPSYAEFLDAIGGRLALVPRYRQKVRRVPFDLGLPGWVDDPDFDLRYHIRQTALPRPGGDEQLRRLMERVMGQRLDRDRPLWEYWMVDRLAGGRWALISKVHHCLVDGVSGTHLYEVLLDPAPRPAAPVPDDWQAAPEPSTLRLLADAMHDIGYAPIDATRALVAGLARPARSGRTLAVTARGLAKLATALAPASASSLSGPIGQPRRYRFVRASMTDVDLVRKAFGGTVNDVVLTAAAAGFRAVLTARGEQPDPRALRSLVPVSVRAPGEESICDNRISLMLADLPVHIDDPVQRLYAIRGQLATLKASREAEAGAVVTSMARFEPFPLVALGMRLAFRLPQRNIVTVTTNVPGPRRPVYALGRRAVEILPYVPIASRLQFGVSIFTYCDQVTFGLTGNRGSTADIDLLTRGITDGLAGLVTAAGRTTIGRDAGSGAESR